MTPANEQELTEAIRAAYTDGTGLRIQGGGTRQALGNPCRSNSMLSTAGLSGISLYEPGALTIVAGAGTPLAEIESALAAEGQRLPFEPMDHRALLGSGGETTIGGVVACNISGPARIQAGACRDSLIGVRFVDSTGAVIKNGGRVMKNVTGYDLVKLMAGSYGTLGVLTEVAFKVLPRPETAATLWIEGLSDTDAVRAMSAALGSPYEISGAAHAQKGMKDTPVTMIRVDGFETSVSYRMAQLQSLLAEFGEPVVEADAARSQMIWNGVRDCMSFAKQTGDVWRISVKPSDGPKVTAKLGDADCVFDWGGGLIWALTPDGTDARATMDNIPGHATLIRGGDETRTRLGAFHPEPAPVAALTQTLRQKFDPGGILNPGIMG